MSGRPRERPRRSNIGTYGVLRERLGTGRLRFTDGERIASVTNERATVGWRDIWAVGKTSVERRLGRPLLVAYLVLALVGVVVVAVSIVVMHL
jgi:hypothetical protein